MPLCWKQSPSTEHPLALRLASESHARIFPGLRNLCPHTGVALFAAVSVHIPDPSLALRVALNMQQTMTPAYLLTLLTDPTGVRLQHRVSGSCAFAAVAFRAAGGAANKVYYKAATAAGPRLVKSCSVTMASLPCRCRTSCKPCRTP